MQTKKIEEEMIKAYRSVKWRLIHDDPDQNPYHATTENGSYILLDALTAMCYLRAAKEMEISHAYYETLRDQLRDDIDALDELLGEEESDDGFDDLAEEDMRNLVAQARRKRNVLNNGGS